MHLKVNCPRNSKMALKFQVAKRSLSYKSISQNNVLINNSRAAWPTLKSFNAIFEFLGQFTI